MRKQIILDSDDINLMAAMVGYLDPNKYEPGVARALILKMKSAIEHGQAGYSVYFTIHN